MTAVNAIREGQAKQAEGIINAIREGQAEHAKGIVSAIKEDNKESKMAVMRVEQMVADTDSSRLELDGRDDQASDK